MDIIVSYFKKTPLSYFYAVIGAIGCILNTSLIMAIKERGKNKTAFEYTLVSLAVSDFLFGAVSVIIALGYRYIPPSARIYETFVYYSLPAAEFPVSSSILHIACIALERTMAIYYPLRHLALASKAKKLTVLATMWILSAIIPIMCITDMTTANLVISYRSIFNIIVGVVIIILYLFLVRKLITKNVNMASIAMEKTCARQKRVTANSLAVTLVYCCCVYPASVCKLLKEWEVLYYTGFLVVLQCILDPLVYFFIHHIRRKKSSDCKQESSKDSRV